MRIATTAHLRGDGVRKLEPGEKHELNFVRIEVALTPDGECLLSIGTEGNDCFGGIDPNARPLAGPDGEIISLAQLILVALVRRGKERRWEEVRGELFPDVEFEESEWGHIEPAREIREPTLEEYREITRHIEEENAGRKGPHKDLGIFERRYKGEADTGWFKVALEGGKPVGVSCGTYKDWENCIVLEEIYIRRGFRGRGRGRAMLEDVIGEAKAASKEKVKAWVASNGGQALVESAGFENIPHTTSWEFELE